MSTLVRTQFSSWAKVTFENQEMAKVIISILNMNGQLVKEFETYSDFQNVDCQQIGTGIYSVRIKKEQQQNFKKLIITNN